ncbi:class I SAM-dependent methyltransferase, partial [Escherichia coli]
MALMFPRLARNFAKNGYYPTDESTLERALSALAPSDGPMCILDPCAGEGVAIAEAAPAHGHAPGRADARGDAQGRGQNAPRVVADRLPRGLQGPQGG